MSSMLTESCPCNACLYEKTNPRLWSLSLKRKTLKNQKYCSIVFFSVLFPHLLTDNSWKIFIYLNQIVIVKYSYREVSVPLWKTESTKLFSKVILPHSENDMPFKSRKWEKIPKWTMRWNPFCWNYNTSMLLHTRISRRIVIL